MEKHEGLPVAGYTPQSDAAVAAVNANKQVEEKILRMLDAMSQIDAVDKRWLAIGRTAIEQGFMAINRSIFKPGRVELPEESDTTENGWLIEDADSPVSAPTYFSAKGPYNQPAFTPDHNQALRFARKEDAKAFTLMSAGALSGVRIAEHSWS